MCLPWMSAWQWHAFSLIKHPTLEDHSSVCIAVTGDWTRALHNELKIPSSRPGWLYGPFPSPFSTATSYDNVVVVASGVGITPVSYQCVYPDVFSRKEYVCDVRTRKNACALVTQMNISEERLHRLTQKPLLAGLVRHHIAKGIQTGKPCMDLPRPRPHRVLPSQSAIGY